MKAYMMQNDDFDQVAKADALEIVVEKAPIRKMDAFRMCIWFNDDKGNAVHLVFNRDEGIGLRNKFLDLFPL